MAITFRDSSTPAHGVRLPVAAESVGPRWYGRISITVTLVTAIGLLTLISAGGVLGVGVWLAQKNTFELLSANAHQGVSAAVNRIEQHLRPAEHQARFVAQRIAAGDIDPSETERFRAMLSGALAAAPQIDSVIYIDNQLQGIIAHYDEARGKVVFATRDYSNDAVIRERMANQVPGANWGSAVWREASKKSYLNIAYPAAIEDKQLGTVVSVVSVENLSRFVNDPGAGGHRFILAGRDSVMAHPLMADGYPGLTSHSPLPILATFKDPILAAMWQTELHRPLGLKLPRGTNGHILEHKVGRYIFVYRRIRGFGPQPLIAGAYFRDTDVGNEVQRMNYALLVGIAALLISLFAAVVIGRKIAAPIVGFSAAAARIQDLNISQVGELPGSVFRELNEQSASFNAMLRALRWFELYVPKRIVEHLVHSGDFQQTESDARNITVLFTDIANFSAISQDLSAPEVADLINHHFTLIGACIEAEQGTVDKFMGDSVMAFWGAPDKQKQRAERACRAALAMAAAVRVDNERRVAEGKPPIGFRVGIHTGTVTVGNIGAPGRINYTIIGDDVNIGKRLEQLGKDIYPPGTDVSILISGDTAQDLSDAFSPVFAGRYELKGRDGEVEVFKLI